MMLGQPGRSAVGHADQAEARLAVTLPHHPAGIVAPARTTEGWRTFVTKTVECRCEQLGCTHMPYFGRQYADRFPDQYGTRS